MPRKGSQKKKGRRPVVQGPVTQSGQRPQIIYVNKKPKKHQYRKKNPIKKGTAEKVGSFLGRGAKAMFKAVTGFGDYKVNSNSLMPNGGQAPIVSNSTRSSGGAIIRHREYVQDMTAKSVFTNRQFAVNPGMSELFPWLSALAQNYEEYEFRGVIFEFKTMSSDLNVSSTTSALGTVIMASQYNVILPQFGDKRTMENYEFACSAKPSSTFVHPLECARVQNVDTHLYVRTGPIDSGDLRLYDIANFQFAVQGMNQDFDDSVIGELWVSYEVELFKPKLLSTSGIDNLADVFGYLTATGSSGNPFAGTNRTALAGSTCGCTIVNNTTIGFPAECMGRYEVYVTSNSNTNSTTTSPSFTSGTSTTCTIINAETVTNLTTQAGFGPQTGSFKIYQLRTMIDLNPTVTGDPNIINLLGFVSVNSDWNTTIRIMQVPPTFENVPTTYP